MGGTAKLLFMGRKGRRERDMFFPLAKRSEFSWCFSMRGAYFAQLRSILIRDSVGSYICTRGSDANRGWRQDAGAIHEIFEI